MKPEFAKNFWNSMESRPQRSVPKWAALVILYLLAFVPCIVWVLNETTQLPVSIGFAAIGLYFVSHALRAVRLALLATNLLGISGRTATAMHFSVAPFSLMLPLKLGEFLRLYALWRISGKAINSFIVLMIDRMFDLLFLLPLLLVLTLQGGAPNMLVFITLAAAAVPLTVVVLGPSILTELQRYVFASHNYPFVLQLLRQVDAARRFVKRSSEVSRAKAAQLSIISLLIWLCELCLCLILIRGVGQALDLLGLRLSSSWWTDYGNDPLLFAVLGITTLTLFIAWPLATLLLFARWKNEPKRMVLLDGLSPRATL